MNAQIKIIDFDQAREKIGIITDKLTHWKLVEASLSDKQISGTPSVVIKHKDAAPYGFIESRVQSKVVANT